MLLNTSHSEMCVNPLHMVCFVHEIKRIFHHAQFFIFMWKFSAFDQFSENMKE